MPVRGSSPRSLAGLAPLVALAATLVLSCESSKESEGSEPSPAPIAPAPRSSAKPEVLLVPDAADEQTEGHAEAEPACPPDMVDVGGDFCIDRFEVSLVDVDQGRPLSPSYQPTRRRTRQLYERWLARAPNSGTQLGRTLAVPKPPSFQLREDFEVRAVSRRGVLPNGYLTRDLSEQACHNAGKRLCRRTEWVTACRGQRQTDFPYGSNYRQGACNVHRDSHPSSLLHGNPSINHLDPRIPYVVAKDGPLLRLTGATAECASRWGDDAVYDMVGNLDEWIDDEEGIFLGGFYSRATRSGCDASISSHVPEYFDYSLGTRCCRDREAAAL